MIFRFIFAFVVLSSCLLGDESKKESDSGSNEYNLVKCLLVALENNPSCKKVAIDKKIASLNFNASTANFEWQLSSATSYTDTNDVVSQTLGISKKFVTGTSVGVTSKVTEQDDAVFDKSSSLVFNISQELLAGATIKENEMPMFIAKIREEQAINRLDDQIRLVLYRVSSNYFQYIKNEETIKVNYNALKQAKKFLETIQELKKAGKGTNLDVATAEVQVATREEAVLQSQTRISNSLDILKQSVGLDIDDVILIDKNLSLDVVLPELNYEDAYLHAINNRTDVKNTKLNIELLNRDLLAKEREKKPNLRLSYSATFSETSDSFGDAIKYSDDPSHALSLQFSMPLLRKSKVADYLEAKYSLEKSDIELWEVTQNIKIDIKRIMREIEQVIKTLEVQTQRMKTEEIRVQSFETRFENGLIDSLEVTRAYDDLDKARIDLINSKLNLKILVSEYHIALGSQPTIILENEKKLQNKKTDQK